MTTVLTSLMEVDFVDGDSITIRKDHASEGDVGIRVWDQEGRSTLFIPWTNVKTVTYWQTSTLPSNV